MWQSHSDHAEVNQLFIFHIRVQVRNKKRALLRYKQYSNMTDATDAGRENKYDYKTDCCCLNNRDPLQYFCSKNFYEKRRKEF